MPYNRRQRFLKSLQMAYMEKAVLKMMDLFSFFCLSNKQSFLALFMIFQVLLLG